MAVATIVANRSGWLVHGLVMLSVLFGLPFNVIAPVRFVAEQNVARMWLPGDSPGSRSLDLDLDYIAGLGSDAAPVVMRALDQMKAPPSMLARLPNALARSSGI